MEIADVISRLGSNVHSFKGMAYNSTIPFSKQLFEESFELLRTATGLILEGSVIPENSEKFFIEFTMPFSGISFHGGKGEFRSRHTDLVSGTLVSNGSGFEFLGRSSTGKPCSCHIEFTSRQAFRISGMVEFSTHCVAFDAQDSANWHGMQAAKIYSLNKKIQ